MTTMLNAVPREILDAAIEFFRIQGLQGSSNRRRVMGGVSTMEAQQLVGEWLDTRDGEGDKINVYRSGEQWVLETWSEDGCHSRDLMQVTETVDGLKLEDRGGNLFGEYFLLRDDQLHLCTESGCQALQSA
ncbi:hypothetical protein [Shewanella sp. GXUN23E]|uniref:hypothetical protein n=1 Tax=Shewanella sp. GXUN23E TaxID=3422498 RepID=UPI003D7DFC6C